MPFTKKFPRSGDTKHIRVPVVYSDLVLELMEVYDSKFEIDKGKHLLRKYINSVKKYASPGTGPISLALLRVRGYSVFIHGNA